MARTVGSWVVAAAVASAAILAGNDALAQDAAARRPQFKIVDIGALPGADEQVFGGSNAVALNNRGEVVGMSHSPIGHRAVRFTENGGLLDLGDPPGGQGGASSINNYGVVVGTGDAAPFMWDQKAGMRAIPGFAGVPGHVTASDISDWGHVVGWIHHDNQARGYLLDPDGRLTMIGEVPGGDTYGGAYSVNNRGEVVGGGRGEGGGVRGFYWSPKTGTVVLPGLSPGGSSNTAAINNAGVVVGFANVSGENVAVPGSHAFSWTLDGGIRDLGTLPGGSHSTAAGVNDHGEVVGYGNGDGVADLVAVFWDRDGTAWNLDDVTGAADQGWHLHQAFGVNDHGDVVGIGFRDGVPRGFLLVSQNPEPGAAAVTAVALCAALLRRRRVRG